jgi:hypothetical protein
MKLFPRRYYVMAQVPHGQLLKAARCRSISDAQHWISVHATNWLREVGISSNKALSDLK